MIHYTITGENDNRILTLVAASAHRFRFFDSAGYQVKFQQVGSSLIAAVKGKVDVYKMPKSNDFHREYMAHARTALWLGLQADPDRLVDNLLEFEETI